MPDIRTSAFAFAIAFPCCIGVVRAAAPRPDVDFGESFRPSPVKHVEDGFVRINGTSSSGKVTVSVTRSTGGNHQIETVVKDGKFSCSYPTDFSGAAPLSAGLLYVDVSTGPDLLKQRAEGVFIVSGKSGVRPDLPAAFTDDFIDAKGRKDRKASTWDVHRELVNLFMRSRGAALSGIGRADFDLSKATHFARFRQLLTIYDFEHRDVDWTLPWNNRVARTFWQAEWNRWFGPGNDHPWDGNKDNRSPDNYRPYTFTNDLADLYILHQMRRSVATGFTDNRVAMCEESLANLIATQHRGAENFAQGGTEEYTEGAFRYGLFETGEWLEEGKGWFVNPKAGDHRHGGVFIGRSVWALGESIKLDRSGPHAKKAAEALALALRFALHDGLKRKYTKSTEGGLPLWMQAGEHGYLTLGMIAAASVMPDMPVQLDPGSPSKPLSEITARALDALVVSLNADGHWTKYPDQDAMGLAALAEGAIAFPAHPNAASWKAAASRVADGWLAAKPDPSEVTMGGAHFGRREGAKMTFFIGDKPEVHINLYISGLWLHALAKTYQLTGSSACRARAEGMLAYLCGGNPFHARLLNEIGGVPNVVRDSGGEESRMNWDCYPESTAFVQIGLLHWLDAIQSKP